jgi:hypothetical protein
MANARPVLIHVHGLRNEVAEFEGGPLLVGNRWGASYAIDIEIAVRKCQVREFVGLILDRSGIGNRHP